MVSVAVLLVGVGSVMVGSGVTVAVLARVPVVLGAMVPVSWRVTGRLGRVARLS